MRLPYLRFNLHHLSLACCVLLAVGMLFYGWPVSLSAAIVLLMLLVTDAIARPGSNLFYPDRHPRPAAGAAPWP